MSNPEFLSIGNTCLENLVYPEQTEEENPNLELIKKLICFLSPLEQTVIQLFLLQRSEDETLKRLKLPKRTLYNTRTKAYKKLKILTEMYEEPETFYLFYKESKLTGKYKKHTRLFKGVPNDKKQIKELVQKRKDYKS